MKKKVEIFLKFLSKKIAEEIYIEFNINYYIRTVRNYLKTGNLSVCKFLNKLLLSSKSYF
ncbi:hypothetical protein HERIO_2506 [Hepatospora eriocheir]|uniref:Uncharacterized protein n=1 Tax=Hepatospora eriocheir TaxID=1081669 RepID=A0A1X0Q6P8_9MICR|nr:hypothetical protein HERIO_2506 [Hepatospora eriocheir]